MQKNLKRSDKNPANAVQKPCPNCPDGWIMVGRQGKFQATVAGEKVCVDCAVKDIYAKRSTLEGGIRR